MKIFITADILKNSMKSKDIFEMLIYAPAIAENAIAGQFLNLYTGVGEHILPRPISICEINAKEGTLRLLYQIAGKGTELFSKLKPGAEIKVMGPLGNGFEILESAKTSIIIGGGIGVPPLLQLTKDIIGKKIVVIAAKTNPILVNEFISMGADVHVATDDGSFGFMGNAVQLMRKLELTGDIIYSCGPKIMLKYVAEYGIEKNIPSQVSMEERMACGIGACVGCAIKIKKQGQDDWQNLKVCKDGPVFIGSEVIWDE